MAAGTHGVHGGFLGKGLVVYHEIFETGSLRWQYVPMADQQVSHPRIRSVSQQDYILCVSTFCRYRTWSLERLVGLN